MWHVICTQANTASNACSAAASTCWPMLSLWRIALQTKEKLHSTFAATAKAQGASLDLRHRPWTSRWAWRCNFAVVGIQRAAQKKDRQCTNSPRMVSLEMHGSLGVGEETTPPPSKARRCRIINGRSSPQGPRLPSPQAWHTPTKNKTINMGLASKVSVYFSFNLFHSAQKTYKHLSLSTACSCTSQPRGRTARCQRLWRTRWTSTTTTVHALSGTVWSSSCSARITS